MSFYRVVFCAVLLSVAGFGLAARADERERSSPRDLSPEHFDEVQALIRPQPGEADWLDIPWEIDAWQARQRAAAEGKPIFFLTGGGKSPLGDC